MASAPAEAAAAARRARCAAGGAPAQRLRRRPQRRVCVAVGGGGDEKSGLLGRRDLGAATAAAAAILGSPQSARAGLLGRSPPLSERLAAQDLPKPFLQSSRPGPTEFPAWLEGDWEATQSFDGFILPNKSTFDTRQLMAEDTVPGFKVATIAALADVGSKDVAYRLRFMRDAKTGKVVEDYPFNIKSTMDSYLRSHFGKDAGWAAVESVETDGPNRVTIRTRQGAAPGGARIELYRNANEVEERASDGTFFNSTTLRQVNLDYSTTAGVAAMGVYDYQLIYTYTPLYDGADDRSNLPARVRSTLSVAAYLQANTAMAFSTYSGSNVPQLGGLMDASSLPVILYSTHADMTRVQ